MVLEETDPSAFRFEDDAIEWRESESPRSSSLPRAEFAICSGRALSVSLSMSWFTWPAA